MLALQFIVVYCDLASEKSQKSYDLIWDTKATAAEKKH